MNEKDILSLARLGMLGDWVKLKPLFNRTKLLDEISIFKDQWKQYNPRKNINRHGLSVTSFDGGLSGIPDLDSLGEYNKENNTDYNNYSCTTLTEVYFKSNELQKILNPFKNHLLRTHLIKLNSGGFFPDHRDCYPDVDTNDKEQVRLIYFINNCEQHSLKFIYENNVLHNIYSGSGYYFNGNKSHCVFSIKNECIFLVVNLKFDTDLYHTILSNMEIN